MKTIDKNIVSKIYLPDKFSHKGQNGKLLIIGGSSLFHGASLWALKTASRVVDMVFYLSTDTNQEYADNLNKQVYDFINIKIDELNNYIKEADAVLVGPGMVRTEIKRNNIKDFKLNKNNIENTYSLVKYLLCQYPKKKWVIDAGALQVMEVDWLKKLPEVIITPHQKEYNKLFDQKTRENIQQLAKKYNCTIVLKGPTDIICSPKVCVQNKTGNEGMTKGGTGDVLAGLVAALACKNDCLLAASAGTYITGLAGNELMDKVGTFFNASDLCEQIPKTFHKLMK